MDPGRSSIINMEVGTMQFAAIVVLLRTGRGAAGIVEEDRKFKFQKF